MRRVPIQEERERERSKRHETFLSSLIYKSTLCSTRLASITFGCPGQKILIKQIQTLNCTCSFAFGVEEESREAL